MEISWKYAIGIYAYAAVRCSSAPWLTFDSPDTDHIRIHHRRSCRRFRDLNDKIVEQLRLRLAQHSDLDIPYLRGEQAQTTLCLLC